MSKRPQFPLRQSQEKRILREAKAREEERAIATLRILQEEADQTNERRQGEEGHKDIERRVWLKQLAAAKVQIKTAQRLNCVTLIAATFALLGVGAVVWSVIDARHATIEANRAWLAPVSPDLAAEIEAGKPIIYGIGYTNTGRDPALNVTFFVKSGVILDPLDGRFDGVVVASNDSCNGAAPSPNSPPVYPLLAASVGTRRAFNTSDDRPPLLATDAIVNGVQDFYVRGCIAYNTFQKTHFTKFCIIFRYKPGAIDKKTDWTFCNSGNDAD